MDQQRATNILTLILVVVWVITAIVRIWVDWPEAVILDSAMPVVIGYWFASKTFKDKETQDEGKHRA